MPAASRNPADPQAWTLVMPSTESGGILGVVMSEKLALAPEAKGLLEKSREWLSDAMDAWSDGAADKVVALAPIAVELAAKAMLWQAHPTLLVPLQHQHEHSLIELATSPRLSSEKLRTVGLGDALKRAVTIASKDPEVDQRRRRRIADCRGGALHVGTADVNLSRHVLTDCIALLVWSVNHLEMTERDYFGSHLEDCRALLDRSRTETQRAMQAKLARHRKQYQRLSESLASRDDSVAKATFETLERSAMTDYVPSGEDPLELLVPAQHECPACKRKAAVYGVASIDADADAEYEDGEIVYHGYWIVTLEPEFFICKVCGLHLWGSQELEPAGLPSHAYQPSQEDLGDFDPTEYANIPDYDDI